MLITALAIACVMWCGLLLTPWQPWRTRERLERGVVASAAGVPGTGDPGQDVVAIVPARNEAQHIAGTLRGLRRQSERLRIIVVDDQSTDGTAEIAAAAISGVEVIAGRSLPSGWTGKLWALQQGVDASESDYLLFVDADIALDDGVLAALRARQREHGAGLVSVMAALAMTHFWEVLLMPAFIYFFKLLYPFSLANSSNRRFCAAAGGCMLLRREALQAAGGLDALRDAIIDDCTLARSIKRAGYRTWVGLSRHVRSTRRYPHLGDTWSMVSRTAYTQLNYSVLALVLCTVLMVISLVVPIVGLSAFGNDTAQAIALATLLAMAASYLPTIRYYGLPWPLAFSLPVVGALFLAMTWTSAWRSWRGVRTKWKDREYGNDSSVQC